MGHSHHHHGGEEFSGKRLLVTFLLNIAITIAEIAGGIISGSLSLISDALHNFSDALAVAISYVAIVLNRRPKNAHYTFGLKRAQIFAAFINAAVLILICFYLFKESYDRFVSPQPVEGGIMILVALVGLAANIGGTLLLKSGADSNINIRSAYLHLFSDAVSSAGVVLGGIAIYLWNIYWLDPLVTVLISVYILKESWAIVRETVDIVVMASPPDISIEKIKERLEKLEKVKNVHHGHLWRLDEKDIHFEAHVEVLDLTVSETTEILENIKNILHDEFNVNHVTIQFECNICEVKDIV